MIALSPEKVDVEKYPNALIPQDDDLLVPEEPEEEEEIPLRYSITSYGADFDVDGLIRRIERKDVIIPDFQRGYVWTMNQASKFIESLIIGLPVPGIFMSKERNTQKLLVIDGQQRLTTLQYFADGIFKPKNKTFELTGLAENSPLAGKTYKTLRDEDRREFDNAIIHATIIKQEEPDDNDSAVYLIFERLNTGGTKLQPQEIRTAIYYGAFSDLLKRLNDDERWQSLVGSLNKDTRGQELILRFFALYYSLHTYQRPMVAFLNEFMKENQKLSEDKQREYARVFKETTSVILENIGSKAFKPSRAFRAAVYDAIMVGVANRLSKGPITNDVEFKQAYTELLDNPSFTELTIRSTANAENVEGRISEATKAFANV